MYKINVNTISLNDVLAKVSSEYIETFNFFKNQPSLTSCDFILHSDNNNFINTFNFYDSYNELHRATRKELIEIKGFSNKKIINESFADKIVNLQDIKPFLLTDTENSRGVTIAFRYFKKDFKVKEHTHPPCTVFCYQAKERGQLFIDSAMFELNKSEYKFFRGDFPHSYNSIGEAILLLIQLKPIDFL